MIQQLPLGLEHVDRRLPAGGACAPARLEELAVELLGLLDQPARFRPHLVFRVTHHANLYSRIKAILAPGKQG